jgi:lipopolysaccharide/colanic/teichoic acid biosynthesis glycosyltransferase
VCGSTRKIAIENLRPSWRSLRRVRRRASCWEEFAKRALDVVAAAIGLVLLSPVMVVALLVR